MRIRVLQSPVTAIDGVRVDLLHEGTTYDLHASVACVLIVEGWAEPVLDPPAKDQRFSERLVAEAAERSHRRY